MQLIFKFGELVPLPELVGIGPECDGTISLDIHEFEPFVEEANLYAPHLAAPICENWCNWGIFADEPDPDDNTWKEQYSTWEELNQVWEALWDKIQGWLRGKPFLVECHFSIQPAEALNRFADTQTITSVDLALKENERQAELNQSRLVN